METSLTPPLFSSLGSSTWGWVAGFHLKPSALFHQWQSFARMPVTSQPVQKDGASARIRFAAPTQKRQQQTCFKTPLLGGDTGQSLPKGLV